MHPIMSPSRSLVALATVSFLTSVLCGCSGRSRLARQLEQANRDYQAGRFDSAEIAYKNVLQADGQNAQAMARLGAIFHEQGRDARALVFLARAKELQPGDAETRVRLGLAFLATGSLKEARDEAIALLERLPQNEHVPLLLVEASPTPKELDDARQRLQALPAAVAKSPAVLVGLGHAALRQKKLDEAEAAFTAALAADAGSAAAHSALGVLRWSQQNLPAADAEFRQAATLAPPRSPKRIQYAQFKLQTGDDAAGRRLLEDIGRETPDYLPVWVWLAELSAREKKYDDAEALLAKALARDPLHAEALLLGARVRLAKGETDRAIVELERLAGLFPKSAQINYQLALAHAARSETGKALARLAQASAAAPAMVEPILATGEIHLWKNDFSAAITVLKPLAQQHPDLASARLLLAEALRGRGDLEEADRLYTELGRQLPRDAAIAYAHGMLLLQRNRPDDARQAFVHAREFAPGHFGALERLTESDLAEKRFDVARQRVEADLAQDPRSVPHLLLLAKIHLGQANPDAAESALQRAVELQPDSPMAHYLLAQIHLTSQQPQKAIDRLQDAVAKDPRNLPALLLLGVIQDERKDYAPARAAYEKALAVNPKSSLALNNLAYLYAERFDQLDQAQEMAQRARALQPQEPRTADTLGWILVRKKQYAAALPILQESAARLAAEPEVLYHLGTACYFLGDEEPARAALRRALELKADFGGATEARQRLAWLDFDPAKADPAARDALEKHVARAPDDAIARLRLAAICQAAGDSEKALGHYRAALQSNPKHVGALTNVARLHAAKSDLPKALESAKAARALAPADPAVAHLLGRLAFQAGDHRWAASLLREAARLRPDAPELLCDWAEADYSIGRVADAEAALRQALSADASFPRVKEARQFLELLSLAADPARARQESAAAERVLQSDPTNVPALMIVASASEQKRDPGAARKAYERALARYPEFSPAQRNLALLLAANPADDQKAAALAAKARTAFPNDPELARAAGMVAYRQGDFPKAASLLQESAGKATENAELLYYLGMAQCRLNRRSEGRISLQRALELGVKETLATEAKKRLASLD